MPHIVTPAHDKMPDWVQAAVRARLLCGKRVSRPLAMDPVDVEVLGQERCADHADALLHPPG